MFRDEVRRERERLILSRVPDVERERERESKWRKGREESKRREAGRGK